MMFFDLVGSTNLAMRLDAEDWRNLVNAYLEEASSAVTSFGGHVLKKLGDGLMALFGYPQAEENDAERAVRAALAIQRAFGELNARNVRSGEPELAARIGIDAGPVVVEAGGEVYGDAPNIAARVQALAEPGSVGATHWFAGEYVGAREHLERALALFQPGRDDDLAFHFGHDAGVAAMLYLALTLWPLGDIGRTVSLIRDVEARIADHPHIVTRAYGKCYVALVELMRGDLSRAARNAVELARLTHEHDLPMWQAVGVFLEGVAKAKGGELIVGLADMRRGVELLREQNTLIFDGLFMIALADVEARVGDVERALAILDEALATCERTGHRAFEAELHRVRGEMLLKRDPANPTCAEEALQTAIAIARRQATRSFELRAALSLAKLCRSTGRNAEAHAVLAPAAEGFSPTPEMPEISEAQALLSALAEMGQVKANKAERQQRLRLEWSKLADRMLSGAMLTPLGRGEV
jgi:predicted ATPase